MEKAELWFWPSFPSNHAAGRILKVVQSLPGKGHVLTNCTWTWNTSPEPTMRGSPRLLSQRFGAIWGFVSALMMSHVKDQYISNILKPSEYLQIRFWQVAWSSMDTPCFWHPGPPTAFQPLYTTSLLTWHEMQLLLHEMQLWLNFSPAHVESCFLSDVHHDSSCFYRVLNSAVPAVGIASEAWRAILACVLRAASTWHHSERPGQFDEDLLWTWQKVFCILSLWLDAILKVIDWYWLYLKLLFRATHFKSRIQRYPKCYNIANYSSMFERMHVHIHKINALQDSFNTWNQSSVFKACREPPVWDNRDVLHNEYRAQITWALICRDVWCIEEGGNHWTSQDTAKLITACQSIWNRFDASRERILWYIFSLPCSVHFSSVFSPRLRAFHRPPQTAKLRHRRTSLAASRCPFGFCMLLTWCLVCVFWHWQLQHLKLRPEIAHLKSWRQRGT